MQNAHVRLHEIIIEENERFSFYFKSLIVPVFTSAVKRLYASTLSLQCSAFVSLYKCLRHIFILYENQVLGSQAQ